MRWPAPRTSRTCGTCALPIWCVFHLGHAACVMLSWSLPSSHTQQRINLVLRKQCFRQDLAAVGALGGVVAMLHILAIQRFQRPVAADHEQVWACGQAQG